MTQISNLQRQSDLTGFKPDPKTIRNFCKALKQKMADRDSQFGKEYLKLLVDEIRIEGGIVRILGKHENLTEMLKRTKVGLPEGVPTFGGNWLPGPDSNQRQGG